MANADDSGVSLSNLDHSSLSESPPLIFQCSQCNTIVGDSLSWVSADKITRTIALSCVSTKVGVKTEISIVSNGRDQGSTYNALYCLLCNENLGKKYIASSPEIDTLRGFYSLDAEKLNSYKLGEHEANNNSLADMISCPNPKEVWRQVSKIKYLLVSMNERLTDVEGKLRLGDKREVTKGHGVRVKEREAEESDNRDMESVTSTENISSKSSYSSDTEVHIIEERQRDSETNSMHVTQPGNSGGRRRNKTPLSPRSNSSHPSRHMERTQGCELRHMERNQGCEFTVPSCDWGSRTVRARRLHASNESEIVGKENDELGTRPRMEVWPRDENVEKAKKRKRID